jgi:hypothetical protein
MNGQPENEEEERRAEEDGWVIRAEETNRKHGGPTKIRIIQESNLI